MVAFMHGFFLAFGLILPLGVQNIFIFNQGSAQKRFFYCLPAVIAATVCDALLISLSVLGVSVIVMKVSFVKYIFFIVGIAFLIYMGITTWKNTREQEKDEHIVPLSSKKQIIFALSVSLLNPHAILDTIGVIGASSIHYHGWDQFLFASAGVLVSFAWFSFLALAGGFLKKLKPGVIPAINKVSALIILGSAAYLVIQCVNG